MIVGWGRGAVRALREGDAMDVKELRKLDAEVAEKVMGWAGVHEVRGLAGGLVGHDPERGPGKTVPAFSSEVGDAWSVVEAMRGKGIMAHVFARTKGYIVHFVTPETVLSRAEADTFPEACSTAALAALGAGAERGGEG